MQSMPGHGNGDAPDLFGRVIDRLAFIVVLAAGAGRTLWPHNQGEDVSSLIRAAPERAVNRSLS